MKKEIKTRTDIEELVNSFYEKVFIDDLLKPVFIDVAQIKPEEHFPVLYDFWESVLFGTPAYKGNPMETHLGLNKKIKLSPDHFDRWLILFNQTIDELFIGQKAQEVKTRAKTIAQLMMHKLNES